MFSCGLHPLHSTSLGPRAPPGHNLTPGSGFSVAPGPPRIIVSPADSGVTDEEPCGIGRSRGRH